MPPEPAAVIGATGSTKVAMGSFGNMPNPVRSALYSMHMATAKSKQKGQQGSRKNDFVSHYGSKIKKIIITQRPNINN